MSTTYQPSPQERAQLEAALKAAEESVVDAKGRVEAAYDIWRAAPPREAAQLRARYDFACRALVQATWDRNEARRDLARGHALPTL